MMASDPSARVVMISAVDQRDKLAECIRHGAVDFIVKPFDADRLKKFFGRYLGS
jgi:two-component system chemotaxis response regulator CheY